METAEYMWALISEEDYNCLLWGIVNNKVITGYKDYNYQGLFREFWQQSPVNYKKYIINKCASSGLLLPDLFKVEDKENISLILKDATASEKEKIISYEGKDICKSLIYSNKWDLLQFFINECISSKDVMIKFKEEFEKRIKCNRSQEYAKRKDVWDKFFQLLDNSIQKHDRKRSVEEDNHPAKKSSSQKNIEEFKEVMTTQSENLEGSFQELSNKDVKEVIRGMEKSRQRHIREKHYRLSTNQLSLLRKERSISLDQPKMVASSASGWMTDKGATEKSESSNDIQSNAADLKLQRQKDYEDDHILEIADQHLSKYDARKRNKCNSKNDYGSSKQEKQKYKSKEIINNHVTNHKQSSDNHQSRIISNKKQQWSEVIHSKQKQTSSNAFTNSDRKQHQIGERQQFSKQANQKQHFGNIYSSVSDQYRMMIGNNKSNNKWPNKINNESNS